MALTTEYPADYRFAIGDRVTIQTPDVAEFYREQWGACEGEITKRVFSKQQPHYFVALSAGGSAKFAETHLTRSEGRRAASPSTGHKHQQAWQVGTIRPRVA